MGRMRDITGKMLFRGEYLPLSGNLLFLRASPEKALGAFVRREKALMFGVRQRERNCSLRDAFEQLLPVAMEAEKWCFVGTASEWTLALHNDGDDFGNSLSGLGKWGKCDALLIQYLPAGLPSGNPHFPYTDTESRRFEYIPFGGESRFVSVSCHQEKHWDFHEYGEPLPEEDTGRYAERFKRNRLTLEMLEAYAHSFGIEPFKEEFYHDCCLFAEKEDMLIPSEREAFMGSLDAYRTEKTGSKVYSIKMVNGAIEKKRLHVLSRFNHEDFDDL